MSVRGYGDDAAKMERAPTIASRLNKVEDTTMAQGHEILELHDLVNELYNSLGIPKPPMPERGITPMPSREQRDPSVRQGY